MNFAQCALATLIRAGKITLWRLSVILSVVPFVYPLPKVAGNAECAIWTGFKLPPTHHNGFALGSAAGRVGPRAAGGDIAELIRPSRSDGFVTPRIVQAGCSACSFFALGFGQRSPSSPLAVDLSLSLVHPYD